MSTITWKPVTATMIHSDDVDNTYQISRTPKTVAGRFTYRAWHRPTSTIIAAAECFDDAGERAAAVVELQGACVLHAERMAAEAQAAEAEAIERVRREQA